MSELKADIDFVEYVVKAMVDNPDAVNVDRTVDDRGVLLTLKVDPTDMGYVIGREGKNATALRTLLRVVGARNNAKVHLTIPDPVGYERPARNDRNDNNDRNDRRNDKDNDDSQNEDTSIVDDLKI